MIVQPRFLSLDTSTIAKLARDFFGECGVKRSEVIAVRDELTDRGWFLTLTCDHLIELAQHFNHETVVSRFKFLQTFKNLAWIWNVEKSGIGSFLDVDCLEIQAFIHNRTYSKKKIVENVRGQLICIGTGNELFRPSDYDLWHKLAEESKRGLAKSQATASILRTEPVQGINQLKLCEFLNADYEQVKDIPRILERLAEEMANQIKTHGDSRVQNEKELAKTFYQQTLQHIDDIRAMQKSGKSETALIECVGAVFGIPASAICLEMTVGQLAEWGHFSMMLKLYSRKLGYTLTLEDVKPEDLPGWSLRSELRDFQNQADSVNGSDFGDCSLACLIPYLDSCEVDKRTMDYLRRITSRKTSTIDYLNHWFRCGDHLQIIKSLPMA